MDTMIAALLRERDELARKGLDDRVRQVDEQLALRGYDVPAPPVVDPEPGPVGRRSQQKRRAV